MLDIVIEARQASLAPGMEVRRILPFRMRRMVARLFLWIMPAP
jgi:hypothetical protein